jgi:flagellar hook protein FlgE
MHRSQIFIAIQKRTGALSRTTFEGSTMSISALNAGLSGMKSYQTALDTSAHNVANASTNEFKPQSIQFLEQANGGVQTKISQEGTQAAANAQGDVSSGTDSGTDVASEIVNQIQYQAGFNFSAKMVKTADQMLGTLIDLKA